MRSWIFIVPDVLDVSAVPESKLSSRRLPGVSFPEYSLEKHSLDSLREAVAAGPPYPRKLLATLRGDERAGARALYERCLRDVRRTKAERKRQEAMLQFESTARENGFLRVAGVDEAGRGPLAGPIVAAAVILRGPVDGLNDSKLLTEEQRDALFDMLQAGGHVIGSAAVSPQEIDSLGIQAANYAAMLRAVSALTETPDFLLVDGFAIPGCAIPHERLVKGDRRSQSIAAASIIAKVTRDRMMDELDAAHPGYGFRRHKGYATREHIDAIASLGPCAIHRKSFAPFAKPMVTGELF